MFIVSFLGTDMSVTHVTNLTGLLVASLYVDEFNSNWYWQTTVKMTLCR